MATVSPRGLNSGKIAKYYEMRKRGEAPENVPNDNAIEYAAAWDIDSENDIEDITSSTNNVVAQVSSKQENIVKNTPMTATNEQEKADCSTLYDPCTREPLADLASLERRVRELKEKLQRPLIETLQFPTEIVSRFDLLVHLLNRDEKPNENLFKYTINGQLFEAYWDIVFALNLIDKYPKTEKFGLVNKKVDGLQVFNDGDFIQDSFLYLESRNVNMGASGASDITFFYKEKKTNLEDDPCSFSIDTEILSDSPVLAKSKFYFCSSKYYKKDLKKSIEQFDIQKIFIAAKNLTSYETNIILLVKDREAVEKKLKRAISKYIAEEATAVYGQHDLFSALNKIYDYVRSKVSLPITKETLKLVLGLGRQQKPILSPRLHQHMAILKISTAIEKFREKRGTSNKFLVGILPRGGKTYIAGGIISELQPKRVVVLLGAKSETITQFKDDLFMKYQDFSDYTIVDVLEETTMVIDPSKKYIFIMSVELYKDEVNRRPILKELKGGTNRADLFLCDEAHLKQTTPKAIKELEEGTQRLVTDKEEAEQLASLDQILNKEIPVVYMTGTYMKPLNVFRIPPENTILWDYQDIQQGKSLSTNEEYFRTNFGEVYTFALEKCFQYGETYESIQAMYKRFPELYLLSTQFTEDAKNAFLQQESGGFQTITHLFRVKKDFNPESVSSDLWYSGFMNNNGMARLINYLSPLPTPDAEPIHSVMSRIDRIAQRIGDRLAFFTKDFIVHSQLWFLPTMQDHPLFKRMCALAGVVFRNPWYAKHFHVLAVSSSSKEKWSRIPGSKHNSISIRSPDGSQGYFTWACPGAGSLKDCILREEAIARQQGKGLIILAQNMLHLGISLSCVDIVVLLDSGEKVDERIQKMYRALTESVNKKGGYIVDMNYFRTVTAILNYQIQTEKSRKGIVPVKEDVPRLFNTILETYSIDNDLPILQTTVETDTVPELERLITRVPTKGNSIVISEAGAAMNRNIQTVLAADYTKTMNEWLGLLKENIEKKTLRAEGQNVQKAENNNSNNNSLGPPPQIFSNTVEANPVSKRIAFLDIFKTTLKLGVFGTQFTSIEDLIKEIENNPEFKDIIYETLVKRGSILDDDDGDYRKEYLFNYIIIPELEKIIEQGRDASYSKMKETFNSKQEKYDEVLKYIVDNLAPKDTERHKYGEVFTPLTLVDEMLSKLPEEVWTNPDLKWLDPANGMGNFPIKAFLGQKEGPNKYLGLLEGLRKKIPDDEKRCKHIIENMLYMIDINKKNNLIAKKLFEKICAGATPNIEQIDKKNGFLADKPLVFNGKTVEKFDIVMGNPPFNRGAVRVAKVTTQTRKAKKELGLEDETGESGFWFKFVQKALTGGLLKENGYLLFIHPITWFKPDRAGAHDLILSKQLITIKIYKNDGSAQQLFGGKGKISAAYYLLLNKTPMQQTTLLYGDYPGKEESIELSTESILLLNYNSIYSKILKKTKIYGNNDNLKHKTIKECGDSGSNKLITILEEKGIIKYVMSPIAHPDQNKPKIIVGGVYTPIVLYDRNGEYGLYTRGQRHYFIGDNLNKINDYFKTKLSTLLLKNIKYEQDFIKPSYFPDVRTIPISSITDETLADYFGFTEDEKAEIAKMPYPIHPKAANIQKISCSLLKGDKSKGGSYEPRKRFAKTRKIHRS